MNIYHAQIESSPILKFIMKYRWLLYACMALSIYLDSILYYERSLLIIYTIVMLLLGLIYNNKWILLLQSGLVTTTRLIVIPESLPFFESFFLLWFTYFMIGIATSTLVSNYVSQQNSNIQLTTTLAKLLDSRDPYTATHSENVASYSQIIAKELNLRKKTQETIYIGGLLHDIGKIVIPEIILNKPAKLTKDEFNVIKQHPQIGYETLKHIETFKDNGILDMVLYHHERYDGNGYPHKLKGNEIPLVARIMAVADAFDAMTSRRVYRDEREFSRVIEELKNNKGKQFDPNIVDVFLSFIHNNRESFNKSKTIS
ncbi:HD-GYP domain-containing protein [Aquibacillus rhizosphaerae]|uniref:HD-GYP domain-containing protein n=1 Tax=Aquibacillus rhizosphaerae TaxID=3051431 RepID=A0ABT7L7M1_9BACI|nr:HD-GYP domain-containing protein [Aquibacillus sp. LR5S19]MDL4841856.1 HD-GYP domain-containing protein [Aquibacillus sp. LR5S19]